GAKYRSRAEDHGPPAALDRHGPLRQGDQVVAQLDEGVKDVPLFVAGPADHRVAGDLIHAVVGPVRGEPGMEAGAERDECPRAEGGLTLERLPGGEIRGITLRRLGVAGPDFHRGELPRVLGEHGTCREGEDTERKNGAKDSHASLPLAENLVQGTRGVGGAEAFGRTGGAAVRPNPPSINVFWAVWSRSPPRLPPPGTRPARPSGDNGRAPGRV